MEAVRFRSLVEDDRFTVVDYGDDLVFTKLEENKAADQEGVIRRLQPETMVIQVYD